MKKVLTWVAIIGLVYIISTNPDGVADAFNTAMDVLFGLFDGIGNIIESIF